MKFNDLEGKTILKAQQMRKVGFDDEGFLRRTFTDGAHADIISYYTGYTGESEDEYPTNIGIIEQYGSPLEGVI